MPQISFDPDETAYVEYTLDHGIRWKCFNLLCTTDTLKNLRHMNKVACYLTRPGVVDDSTATRSVVRSAQNKLKGTE